MAKKKHGGLIAFLVVIVALTAAIVGIWGTSLWHIKGNADKAVEAYKEYEALVEDNDIAGAVSKVHTFADYVAEIEAEFSGWQWNLAAGFPILGEDVRCVRGLAQITDELANKALLPVLTHAEDLLGGASTSDFTSIDAIASLWTEKSELLTMLANDISNARSSIDDCKKRIDELPTSHFAKVNDLVKSVKNAVEKVDNYFDKFDLAKQFSNLWESIPWLNGGGSGTEK